MKSDTRQILTSAREALKWAELGGADLVGRDPTRRIAGLANVVVWGRSVTNRLQNLRTSEGQAFDDWYQPHVEVMRQDPLLKHMYDLRSEILKEGGPKVSQEIYVQHFSTEDLEPLMANKPPGARGFFVWDALGGSGWEVQLSDGSTGKYYVELPGSVKAIRRFTFPDPPTEHLGQEVTGTSVENIASLYLSYLDGLLKEAELRFKYS